MNIYICPSCILPTSTNVGMCRVIRIKITNIKFHNKKCDGNWCCPVKTDGGVHDETSSVFSEISFHMSLQGLVNIFVLKSNNTFHPTYSKFFSCALRDRTTFYKYNPKITDKRSQFFFFLYFSDRASQYIYLLISTNLMH